MTDLATTLMDLHDWIEQAAADVLDGLNEPASAEVLAKLNEAYGGRVPEDVLTVYAWHEGGQIPDPWWELSEIDEIVRVKELHESMPDLQALENWWSDSWIPIGADFDGNHLCVDVDGCFGGIAGQVLVYMHDEEERVIVAPSLGAYFEVLLLACRTGILDYDEDEGFMAEGNQKAWEEFLSAHLDGYPKKGVATLG